MIQKIYTVKIRNQKLGQKGGAALELAIILPLLAILVFGIIDVGFLLYNKQIITNASREGARAGIAWAGETAIKGVVLNYCNSTYPLFPNGTLITDSDVTVSGGASFQDDLTVRVSYVNNFMFAGILGLSPTKTITGETVMKMEDVPSP